MMPEEPTKPVRVRPPRAVDDYYIMRENGTVYQGLNSKGEAQFGHFSMGELFRSKTAAETLMGQQRISMGQTLHAVTTSNIKNFQPNTRY